jgi:parallel beta-helix repeat protein
MEYTNNSNIFNTDIYSINGYGLYLLDSNSNTFNIIFIDDVTLDGIYIDSSTGNSFTMTHIGPFLVSGTIGSSGIYLDNSNSNTFQQTMIQQTNWDGIYLDNSDNNFFNDTRLDGIGGSGIYLFFSHNNSFGTKSLAYNEIYNIIGDGVTIQDSSDNEFYWLDIDTVNGNGNGVTIVSPGIGAASNNNLISNSLIQFIDNSGIFLDGSGNQIQGTSIIDCDISFTALVTIQK